jgi:hypothetical protein
MTIQPWFHDIDMIWPRTPLPLWWASPHGSIRGDGIKRSLFNRLNNLPLDDYWICVHFCVMMTNAWWSIHWTNVAHDKICTASHTYIHTYMFCPYVISTLYELLAEYKGELSKDTFHVHSSLNFTPKRNELRYHCCLSKLYFIGH